MEFADFAFTVSNDVAWHWLDLSVSPFSPALGVQLIVTFVGFTRPRLALVLAIYVWAVSLAVGAWLAFAVRPARAWIDSQLYSAGFMGLNLAAIGCALTRLLQHSRRARDREEVMRTRTMIMGMLIAGILGTTDLWDDFGVSVPALANIGALIGTTVLAWATMRIRFFGHNLPPRIAAIAAVLAVPA